MIFTKGIEFHASLSYKGRNLRRCPFNTLRFFFYSSIVFLALVSPCWTKAPPQLPLKKKAISFIGKPDLDPGTAKSLPGANPDAPKGGTIRAGVVGSFDTLNGLNGLGHAPMGLQYGGHPLVFERLMKRAPTEVFTLYGCLAEYVQVDPEGKWTIFHINPKAKFSDGKPVTAADVLYSHQQYKARGYGPLKLQHMKVEKAELLSPLSIKFTFKPVGEKDGKKAYNQELPFNIALMFVIPKHHFKKHGFTEVTTVPPIGSGPYKIKSVNMGRGIEYERRLDHWGKDLFYYQGTNNFDKIVVHFYMNKSVADEAFKAGDYDFRLMSSPKEWEVFDAKALREGKVIKVKSPHNNPVGIQGFIMNTRDSLFGDANVRKAFSLALSNKDEIIQKHFSGHLHPITSYFENTTFQSKADVSEEEEKALAFLDLTDEEKAQLRKNYQAPLAKDDKAHRRNLREALMLLKKAGWETRKGKLVHSKTGKPFEFSILVFGDEKEKLALIVKDTLKPLGMDVKVRPTDSASYWNRLFEYDFQTTFFSYGGTRAPGTEQIGRWHSNSAEGQKSINFAGVRNPLVDKILEQFSQIKDLPTYIGAIRLLDRALLSGNYMVHLFYSNFRWLVMWDKFHLPPHDDEIGFSYAGWWAKEAYRKKG